MRIKSGAPLKWGAGFFVAIKAGKEMRFNKSWWKFFARRKSSGVVGNLRVSEGFFKLMGFFIEEE